ncbi:12308_t:CDS:2 [Acaulospora morrowiae]|uniref:12308_t:CDS:1 n=1 Tax=Acaulospora morrowiae TaxID=94023 RepID=A0A9N8V9Y7_9GLOM|nr:12308_t:CDS:2 [Acaulospora morrowiae]
MGYHTSAIAFFVIFLTVFSASLAHIVEPEDYFYGRMKFQADDESIIQGPPTLEDIIPIEKDLTRFVDYLRSFGDIIGLISNPNSTITLFAPVNSAFRNLTHKPHQVKDSSQDPKEKLYQFVLGHIVPAIYETLPVGQELQTMRQGIKVKVENGKDGGYKLNGEINTGVTKKAVNGIIYKIDGVLTND